MATGNRRAIEIRVHAAIGHVLCVVRLAAYLPVMYDTIPHIPQVPIDTAVACMIVIIPTLQQQLGLPAGRHQPGESLHSSTIVSMESFECGLCTLQVIHLVDHYRSACKLSIKSMSQRFTLEPVPNA